MLKNSKQNDLEQYLKRRYAVRLLECEECGYFVEIPDLPGCMSQEETVAEALSNIQEAKELWLEGAVESGYDVPEPADDRKFSGKFLVRLPVSLHERLVEEAEREGVSLNSYVTALLAERNAFRVAARKAVNSIPDARTGTHARVRGQPQMVEHVAEKPRQKYRAG